MKEWLHRILRNDQIKGRQFRSQGMIDKKENSIYRKRHA